MRRHLPSEAKHTWTERVPPLQKLTESHPLLRGVLVHTVLVQEVHGHIKCILHIAGKPKIVVPDERQDPTPVIICVGPHMTAPRAVACKQESPSSDGRLAQQ